MLAIHFRKTQEAEASSLVGLGWVRDGKINLRRIDDDRVS